MYFDNSKSNDYLEVNTGPPLPREPYMDSLTDYEIMKAESLDEIKLTPAHDWEQGLVIPPEVANSNGDDKPVVTVTSFLATEKSQEDGEVWATTGFDTKVIYSKGDLPNRNAWIEAEKFRNVLVQSMWGLAKYRRSELLSEAQAPGDTRKELTSWTIGLSERWKNATADRLPLVYGQYIGKNRKLEELFDCAYLGQVTHCDQNEMSVDEELIQACHPTSPMFAILSGRAFERLREGEENIFD